MALAMIFLSNHNVAAFRFSHLTKFLSFMCFNPFPEGLEDTPLTSSFRSSCRNNCDRLFRCVREASLLHVFPSLKAFFRYSLIPVSSCTRNSAGPGSFFEPGIIFSFDFLTFVVRPKFEKKIRKKANKKRLLMNDFTFLLFATHK